jgi:HEAT repeat protein
MFVVGVLLCGAVAAQAPDLGKQLTDPSWEVRREALRGVERKNDEFRDLVAALADALRKEQEKRVLLPMFKTIQEIGPSCAHRIGLWLPQFLAHHDSDVREAAAATLTSIRCPPELAVPVLIPLLKDESLEVRRQVTGGFMVYGYEARAAAPTLIEIAANAKEDKEVRTRAVMSLGKIGLGAKAALPIMIAAFKDKENDAFLRRRALISAGMVAPEDKGLLTSLLESLQSKTDFEDCRSAILTIQTMGPAAKETVPALLVLLQANDVRPAELASSLPVEIVNALGRIGPEARAAIPHLIDTLKCKTNDPLRVATAWALGEMGSAAKEAIPALREASKHGEHPAVRDVAREALRKLER